MFGGVRVITSNALPLPSTDAQDARRIVRHGLADVLEWLGEDVGPRPGDPTHAFMIGNTLHASVAFVGQLKAVAETPRP